MTSSYIIHLKTKLSTYYKFIYTAILLCSFGLAKATEVKGRVPACHKSFMEHHFGLNYGLGYGLRNGLVHKFSLGYQRELVNCNKKIHEPSKNLFWFDYSPTIKKFGYSRVFQLEDYFYTRARNNFDRKYEFWGKIVHATQLETGIGINRSEDQKGLFIFRLSPKLDFRIKDRFEISPFYLIDLSIRKPRFRQEMGLKLGFHFGLRKERGPHSNLMKWK